jgi:hypothetical protein
MANHWIEGPNPQSLYVINCICENLVYSLTQHFLLTHELLDGCSNIEMWLDGWSKISYTNLELINFFLGS